MSLAGLSLDGIKTYGKEQILLTVKWTITGSSGAVDTISGRGFQTNEPHVGSVTRDSEGVYSVVFPGRGAFFDLTVVGVALVVNSGNLDIAATACTPSSRTVTVSCTDRDTPWAVNDPAAADEIHLTVLVKNTDVR